MECGLVLKLEEGTQIIVYLETNCNYKYAYIHRYTIRHTYARECASSHTRVYAHVLVRVHALSSNVSFPPISGSTSNLTVTFFR